MRPQPDDGELGAVSPNLDDKLFRLWSDLLAKGLAAVGELFYPVIVGHDPADMAARQHDDLKRKHSTTGDGKRITSGYAYAGLGPALAWDQACRDRLYAVMKKSIDTFDGRWSEIRPSLGRQPFHYVSLGPGDGQKDAVILRDMWRDNDHTCYFAVDASTEMLQLAIRDLILRHGCSRERMLPLAWDISADDDMWRLRQMLTAMFKEAPVLFSLLGNTLANFDDDTGLLRMLTEKLLRPQDRLLLELTTAPYLNDKMACEAAMEYERSHSFGEWVTSAVRCYTDLHVRPDDVEYQGSVEADRALLIKMIYQNQTAADTQFTLLNGETVPFRFGDTIRLNLTRKYTEHGLEKLLADSGLVAMERVHADFTATERDRPGFGMELMLLSTELDRTPKGGPGWTRATRDARATAVWQ